MQASIPAQYTDSRLNPQHNEEFQHSLNRELRHINSLHDLQIQEVLTSSRIRKHKALNPALCSRTGLCFLFASVLDEAARGSHKDPLFLLPLIPSPSTQFSALAASTPLLFAGPVQTHSQAPRSCGEVSRPPLAFGCLSLFVGSLSKNASPSTALPLAAPAQRHLKKLPRRDDAKRLQLLLFVAGDFGFVIRVITPIHLLQLQHHKTQQTIDISAVLVHNFVLF